MGAAGFYDQGFTCIGVQLFVSERVCVCVLAASLGMIREWAPLLRANDPREGACSEQVVDTGRCVLTFRAASACVPDSAPGHAL